MSKAATTRLNILQKAFELVYKNGYRTTSIDEIIATTQVTKGAFFYHFKNKDEMGIAMINEVMLPGLYKDMVLPLINSNDPITEIYASMHTLLLENPFFIVKYGCPAINLVEEMASYNETFKTALSKLTNQWQEAIAAALEKGKIMGTVRQDVNTAQAALFILSGYGGIRNLGKIYGKEIYTGHLNQLKSYLNSLS